MNCVIITVSSGDKAEQSCPFTVGHGAQMSVDYSEFSKTDQKTQIQRMKQKLGESEGDKLPSGDGRDFDGKQGNTARCEQ
ncbi:unnamed protein product [Gongylonema pulchrum]|uniref:Uncharacterized protein n=1 Tax=Gongylonema pulchrum TaxID=637853 RepID=A0A3P7PPI1_9BILA|nr:unnamed protein product [Gongylonema pulchrum]